MYFKIVSVFFSFLKKKIFSDNLSKAIDLSVVYIDISSFNYFPIYDLSDVEEYLLSRILEDTIFYNKNYVSRKKSLFIITIPYLTGGHTRLMENLSLMMPADRDLLITRSAEYEVKKRLEFFFSSSNECIRLKGENSIYYINRIVDCILPYELVFLSIHPDDIYTVLACGIVKSINENVKIFFINHADHVPSYGATVADIWYQISLYGSEIDKKRNIKGMVTFLGIPINKSDEYFFKKINYPKADENNIFLTAASSNKYKPCSKESIFQLLIKIVNTYKNSTVFVIGPSLLKNHWWWTLFLRYHNEIKFHKSLPYEDYLNFTKRADFYIDSHPAPGGTAFVEQFLQGVPCIGLKTGFYGYTPLELIKSNSIDEAIDMLNNPPSELKIKKLQKYIFEVHGFSNVKLRFISSVYGGMKSFNPMVKYSDNIVTNKKTNLSLGFLSLSIKLIKFILMPLDRKK